MTLQFSKEKNQKKQGMKMLKITGKQVHQQIMQVKKKIADRPCPTSQMSQPFEVSNL